MAREDAGARAGKVTREAGDMLLPEGAQDALAQNLANFAAGITDDSASGDKGGEDGGEEQPKVVKPVVPNPDNSDEGDDIDRILNSLIPTKKDEGKENLDGVTFADLKTKKGFKSEDDMAKSYANEEKRMRQLEADNSKLSGKLALIEEGLRSGKLKAASQDDAGKVDEGGETDVDKKMRAIDEKIAFLDAKSTDAISATLYAEALTYDKNIANKASEISTMLKRFPELAAGVTLGDVTTNPVVRAYNMLQLNNIKGVKEESMREGARLILLKLQKAGVFGLGGTDTVDIKKLLSASNADKNAPKKTMVDDVLEGLKTGSNRRAR